MKDSTGTTGWLCELRDAANAACEDARKEQDCDGWCVNWGDLKCFSAVWCVDDTGDAYATVVIDEASPDNWKFHEYIAEQLARRGFANVVVRTEW